MERVSLLGVEGESWVEIGVTGQRSTQEGAQERADKMGQRASGIPHGRVASGPLRNPDSCCFVLMLLVSQDSCTPEGLTRPRENPKEGAEFMRTPSRGCLLGMRA